MDENTLGEIEIKGDLTAKTWFEKMANAASSRSSRSVSPAQRQKKQQQLAVINEALTARRGDGQGVPGQGPGTARDVLGTARGSLQGSVQGSVGSKGSPHPFTTTTVKSKTPFAASPSSSPLRGHTPAGSAQNSVQGSLQGSLPGGFVHSPSFKDMNIQATGNPLRKASVFTLPTTKKAVFTASYKKKRRFQLPTVFSGADGPALPAIRGHLVLRFSVARPSASVGYPTEAMVATERR